MIRARDVGTNGRTPETGERAAARRGGSRVGRVVRFAVLLLVAAAIVILLAQRYLGTGGTGAMRADGTLEATEVTISSEVTARIDAVPFAEGQAVHAGDVVVRLDDTVPQIQYREASVTDRLVLEAELAHYVLRAPRDGVVLRRTAEPGEVAVIGAPLLVLADLSNLDLTLYVRQRDLGRVRPGQRTILQAEALPDRTFAGVVTSIADKAEFTPRNTETAEDRLELVFAVKVRVPNPDRQLKPGMTVSAQFGD